MTRVRQISNMLDVLEYFAATGRPAGLKELAEHFGWPRSSTFNIIDTLVERGFLYEPRPRGGFYPTPRWLSLAQEIDAAEPLPRVLESMVHDLARDLDETTWIAAPTGQNAVILCVAASSQSVRYVAEPGKQLPLFATATGHALLSLLTPRQLEAALRHAAFHRYGPGTPMTVNEVKERIEAGRARGWFESASNFSPDLGGVSIPLSLDGRVYAITTAGPLFRFSHRTDAVAQAMQRAIATVVAAPGLPAPAQA